tara:strand:+ start:505 stop:1416 length:912 start_codon:yes stop_codon:yes gene_type:complete
MKCDNCKSNNSKFDIGIGEYFCNDCGYVIVSQIFEERPSFNTERNIDKKLGSLVGDSTDKLTRRLKRTEKFHSAGKESTILPTGMIECNMVLSPYLPNHSLQDRVEYLYKKIFADKKITAFTIRVRAVGIVICALREMGIPVSVKTLSKNNEVNPYNVSKCARKIASIMEKPQILHQENLTSWVESGVSKLLVTYPRKIKDRKEQQVFLMECKELVLYISRYLEERNITFIPSHMAVCIWMLCLLRTKTSKSEFTQGEIANVFNCSTVTLRTHSKTFFNIFNVNKNKLKDLNVNEFIAGVRYG